MPLRNETNKQRDLCSYLQSFALLKHKARSIEHQASLELTGNGLSVYFANYYITWKADYANFGEISKMEYWLFLGWVKSFAIFW